MGRQAQAFHQSIIAKIDERAQIILNCASVIRFRKLHRQLESMRRKYWKHSSWWRIPWERNRPIVGIKGEYKDTVVALNRCVFTVFPRYHCSFWDCISHGDEVVLIYEATGRVVRLGVFPIEEGIAVFTGNDVANIYRL